MFEVLGGKKSVSWKAILTVVDHLSMYAHFILWVIPTPLNHCCKYSSPRYSVFTDLHRLWLQPGVHFCILASPVPGIGLQAMHEIGFPSLVRQLDGGGQQDRDVPLVHDHLTSDRCWQWVCWLPWAGYIYRTSFHAAQGNPIQAGIWPWHPSWLAPLLWGGECSCCRCGTTNLGRVRRFLGRCSHSIGTSSG